MAKSHFMVPTVPTGAVQTVRLGAGTGAANNLADVDEGKFTKLVAESRHNLAAVGDDIEGVITSVESATSGGFSIGGVLRAAPGDMLLVTFDGLQASPGTGTIAIGDVVNVGTPVAKGTAQTTYPKVCKATTAANVVHKWRVVSLGSAGTGAVGTTGVIERI